jgi:hypothetical protein
MAAAGGLEFGYIHLAHPIDSDCGFMFLNIAVIFAPVQRRSIELAAPQKKYLTSHDRSLID